MYYYTGENSAWVQILTRNKGNFHSQSGKILEQVVQGYKFHSLSRHFKNLAGQGPTEADRTPKLILLWAVGWIRPHLEAVFKLNYCMIYSKSLKVSWPPHTHAYIKVSTLVLKKLCLGKEVMQFGCICAVNRWDTEKCTYTTCEDWRMERVFLVRGELNVFTATTSTTAFPLYRLYISSANWKSKSDLIESLNRSQELRRAL